VLALRCPRGLGEPALVDLLRSSFPRLAADGQRFDVLAADERRSLTPLRMTTLEELQRKSGSSGGKWTLYVRLKVPTAPVVL